MSAATCPVCQQELSSALCSRCGFDRSRHYECYPTLVRLPDEQRRPLSALRAAWQASLAPEVQDPAVLFQRALQTGSSSEPLELLSRASFLGYPPAQAFLGERYLLQGKPELAFSLLQAAAQQGNSDACYRLSLCYRDGVGVQPSPQRALSWLTQASARGHIKAGTELADKLLTGKELPRDLAKAEELYRRAALAGSADGLVHLAKCFRDGIFVPRSPVKASVLLKEAGKHGSQEALLLLDDLKGKPSPPPPPKSAGAGQSSAPDPSGKQSAAKPNPQASKSNPQAAKSASQAAKSNPQAAKPNSQAAKSNPQAAKPDPQTADRRYAQGRAYEKDRFADRGTAAAAQSKADAKAAGQAAKEGPRPYSQGRAYEKDRYEKAGAAAKASSAARPAGGTRAPSASRTQPAAGSPASSQAPASSPSPTAKLENKSLGSLKARRVVDVILILYMITLAACAFGNAFGTEASFPAGATFCVFAWLLFRRCRTLTRAIKAKTAAGSGPKP